MRKLSIAIIVGAALAYVGYRAVKKPPKPKSPWRDHFDEMARKPRVPGKRVEKPMEELLDQMSDDAKKAARHCVDCNASLEDRDVRATRCTSCAAERKRVSDRDRMRKIAAEKAKETALRKCPDCDGYINRNDKRAMRCAECARKRKNAMQAERRTSIRKPRFCACGVDISALHNRSVRCESCQADHRRKIQREYQAARRASSSPQDKVKRVLRKEGFSDFKVVKPIPVSVTPSPKDRNKYIARFDEAEIEISGKTPEEAEYALYEYLMQAYGGPNGIGEDMAEAARSLRDQLSRYIQPKEDA